MTQTHRLTLMSHRAHEHLTEDDRETEAQGKDRRLVVGMKQVLIKKEHWVILTP